MQVHALDRRARRAFAEIVQTRHDHRLIRVTEHREITAIRAVARLHIQKSSVEHAFVAKRQHADKLLAGIRLHERVMQRLRTRRDRQLAQRQRHRHREPLVETRHNRTENRRLLQARVHAHFRQMLVHQPQRIRTRTLQRLGQRRLLVVGDHLLAAAAVARDRKTRQREIRRHQPALHQRTHRERERRRMAPRIGDAFARADRRAIFRAQFRHAVNPRRVDAMRRRCVDHARLRIRHQRRRLLGRRVGQTQESDIHRVQTRRARRRILALRRIDLDQFQLGTQGEALMDLQTRGAFLPIDKYLGFHREEPVSRRRPRVASALAAPSVKNRRTLRLHVRSASP